MSRTPPWRKALPVPADGKGNLRVHVKYDLNGAVVEGVFEYRDLPVGVVQEILRMVRESKPVIHILWSGRALCGRPGLPCDWPKGHEWVAFLANGPNGTLDEMSSATCQGCIDAAGKALQKHDWRLTKERDIK